LCKDEAWFVAPWADRSLGFLVAHGLFFFVVDGWFVSEFGAERLVKFGILSVFRAFEFTTNLE